MGKDFLKKEPSKTERMLYELAMHQETIERRQLTNSAHILAMGMLLNVDPEKIAALLANPDDKVKEYGDKINKALDKFYSEQKAKETSEPKQEEPKE
jgi:hypothetical protein